MNSMRKSLNLFNVLLVTILLTGCEKKGFVDSIVEMYDNGIETVDKAESVEEVQKYYNDINEKVKEFKQSHLKEMATLDSAVNKIEEAKMIFTKACCIKAFSFDNGYIKDTEGVTIGVNDAGKVLPLECIVSNDDLSSEEYEDGNSNNSTNPLNIIGYTHFFNPGRIPKHFLSVQTSNGDFLYNEEDAEQYYDYYISQFFFASEIGWRMFYDNTGVKESTIEYVKNNLFDIVTHLPLDNSYPNDVVECVNKVYYDNKEEAATLHLIKRDYGKSVYGYYKDNNKNNLYKLNLSRHNEGKLIIWIAI